VIPTPLDYAISVNTYSTLALGAAMLATYPDNDFAPSCDALLAVLTSMETTLERWEEQIDAASWLDPRATYYFLARGVSLASCFQARLLWEEGAKLPATAMSSSGFRHGPQEIVVPGMRFCLWIDPSTQRDQDLAVADDLKTLGASVMLIGQELADLPEHLVMHLPETPPGWQFILDIMPIQLAAERLSRLAGVDCDTFRVCSFIVEDEYGLLGKKRRA
jgi:glucosamine--fructose-6-phosphate aminotransferase (isomerizing)